MEDYVHRVGRTGRAGSAGQATSFYTDRDLVPSVFLFNLFVMLIWIYIFICSDPDWCSLVLKFLVAQIKKAIADAQSGNKVAFATGKVWIFSATHSDEVCVFIFYHICNLFLSLPATLSLTSLQCIVVFILYIEVGQLKCFSMTYSSFLCYSKTKC